MHELAVLLPTLLVILLSILFAGLFGFQGPAGEQKQAETTTVVMGPDETAYEVTHAPDATVGELWSVVVTKHGLAGRQHYLCGLRHLRLAREVRLADVLLELPEPVRYLIGGFAAERMLGSFAAERMRRTAGAADYDQLHVGRRRNHDVLTEPIYFTRTHVIRRAALVPLYDEGHIGWQQWKEATQRIVLAAEPLPPARWFSSCAPSRPPEPKTDTLYLVWNFAAANCTETLSFEVVLEGYASFMTDAKAFSTTLHRETRDDALRTTISCQFDTRQGLVASDASGRSQSMPYRLPYLASIKLLVPAQSQESASVTIQNVRRFVHG